jgi:integrase
MPRNSEKNQVAAHDLAIKAASARGGKPTEYTVADSDGLTLRVEPSGSASYYVRYSAGGKRQRMRLGARGVLPLKDARKRAKEIAVAIEKGEDPVASAQARASSPTFKQLWDERKKHGEARSVHTINSYEQALNQFAMKEIGDVPADEIGMDKVAALLRKVHTVSPHRAHVVRCAIGSTYRWGYKRGSVKTNPTIGLGFIHTAEPRERRVTADEIGKFWTGVEGKEGPTQPMRIILKLALLTGQRTSTIAGARIDELDLQSANPRWRVSRSRMKNKRAGEHLLPLVPAVAKLFREAIDVSKHAEFVFPSEGKGDHIDKHSISRAMNRLCSRVGIEDLHAHDFRKAINTWMAEHGVSYDVRTRVLHHATPDVTSRNYDFSILDGPMRDAMQKWADHIDRIVASKAGNPNVNVVQLTQR